jgi:hypothetical protein
MRAIKRYLSRFCLALAGLCISLFLAEGFVRIFFPYSRDHVVPSGLFDIDGYLGWKLKVGKSVTHHSHYFNVVYTINSLGFRDKPRNVPKGKNVYRILLYGDSQIFGWGVPEDKRFSNLIENQTQHLEIWNLAVPGYGLDQGILSYERDGKSLNADEIIFFVSENTLERTRYNYIYKKHKPMFVIDEIGGLKLIPIPKGKTTTTSLLYKILSPMYLPYFLERRSEMLKDMLKKSSYGRSWETNTEGFIPSERIGDFEKKMFIMARNMALERKQRIVILVELPKAKSKNIEDFCNRNGIGFLKIAFDDHNEKQGLIFGKYDGHWNPQGHKLVAQQLSSQMEKMSNGGENILPKREKERDFPQGI